MIAPPTLPVRSISSTRWPNFSGFSSAASTTAFIFSTVRPDTPAKAPILSRVWPSLKETFLDWISYPPRAVKCFPGAAPPCSFCLSLAASFSFGSSALLMLSISEGRKSLRIAFSSFSPRTISSPEVATPVGRPEIRESFPNKPEKGQTRDKGTLGKVSLGSTGKTRAYVGGLLRQMLPPLLPRGKPGSPMESRKAG